MIHREPRVPRVVVGVGESPSSAAALAWAMELCRSRGWLLDVVTAWPDWGAVPVHEVPGHYCDARGRAVAALRSALASCADLAAEVHVAVHVDNADVVDALTEHSSQAVLVVLGEPASGRSRAAGSPPVADELRMRTPCPVVVVPARRDDARRTA